MQSRELWGINERTKTEERSRERNICSKEVLKLDLYKKKGKLEVFKMSKAFIYYELGTELDYKESIKKHYFLQINFQMF